MLIHRYANRLLCTQIEKKGLDWKELNDALVKSIETFDGQPFELSHRILLNAIVSYRKGGRILDLGGRWCLYQPMLRHLGMDVEIVDYEFDAVMKERFGKLGISVTEQSIYDFTAIPERYDVISSFECFEHLPHSPKKLMDKIKIALKPGGNFVLSVPNVARFEQRWRLLIGQTPFEKYSYYYHSGDYFPGHHREMTVSEVSYLLKENGLAMTDLFTTDMTLQSMLPKKRHALKKLTSYLNYRYLITDAIMPRNLRKHIWASGTKAS